MAFKAEIKRPEEDDHCDLAGTIFFDIPSTFIPDYCPPLRLFIPNRVSSSGGWYKLSIEEDCLV